MLSLHRLALLGSMAVISFQSQRPRPVFQVARSTRTQKSRIPFLEPQEKPKISNRKKKNEPPLKKNPLLSLAGLSSRSLLVVLLGNRWSHLPQVLRQRLLVLLVILRAKARGSLRFWEGFLERFCTLSIPLRVPSRVPRRPRKKDIIGCYNGFGVWDVFRSEGEAPSPRL